MMLEAAPTPCRRTGFHIKSSSECAALVCVDPAVVQATCPAAVEQVGSIMSISPGLAASIAVWMLAAAATCVGALPPMVTVTVSTDCLPLDAVITSSPHCAVKPPYCTCCCTGQLGTPVGTAPVMVRSPQLTPVRGRATLSEPTRATVPAVVPK